MTLLFTVEPLKLNYLLFPILWLLKIRPDVCTDNNSCLYSSIFFQKLIMIFFSFYKMRIILWLVKSTEQTRARNRTHLRWHFTFTPFDHQLILSLVVTNLVRHSSTSGLKSIRFLSRCLVLITEITGRNRNCWNWGFYLLKKLFWKKHLWFLCKTREVSLESCKGRCSLPN